MEVKGHRSFNISRGESDQEMISMTRICSISWFLICNQLLSFFVIVFAKNTIKCDRTASSDRDLAYKI